MADITKTTSADALGLDAQAEMLKTERRANNGELTFSLWKMLPL